MVDLLSLAEKSDCLNPSRVWVQWSSPVLCWEPVLNYTLDLVLWINEMWTILGLIIILLCLSREAWTASSHGVHLVHMGQVYITHDSWLLTLNIPTQPFLQTAPRVRWWSSRLCYSHTQPADTTPTCKHLTGSTRQITRDAQWSTDTDKNTVYFHL